jgi:hypothetical protein
VLHALQDCVNSAQRFGPLLGGLIDPEATERLAQALHVQAAPIDPPAHVGVVGSALPDGARWAIALSGMYTIAQRATDATLAPFAPERSAKSLTILRDYWGVNAETPEARRTQTIDRLEWLINQGDRADPQCAEPGDPEAPTDLLAWDLARAAMTARHAYLAQCVGEAEAWTYLLTIAIKAQESFESWRDFGDRYRRGRIRWSNARQDRFDDILAFLVDDPRSPWRSLPWRMRLDVDNVRGRESDGPKSRRSVFVSTLWRRNGRLGAQLAAILAVVLILVGWEAARLTRSPSIDAAPAVSVSPVAEPLDDPSSARGEFERIQVVFIANGDGARAQFRSASIAHPLADFRYGVDHPVPDRALTPRLLEKAIKGLPQALDLPPGAHFLTIQAQLDSGAISPIRRFDVPANLLAPRR